LAAKEFQLKLAIPLQKVPISGVCR
jgi:hypothetical protein